MSQREGSLGQACVAAIQFLTRIPVPIEVPFTNAVLKRSTLFFPVAGLLVGFVTWVGGWLLQQILPVMPAAALTLLIMLGMTGGLHLDGLMDTADGILSHRSRERMLEIMKDSRVGAMGVIACVVILLLQWSVIAACMEQGEWNMLVVLPFLCSRLVMVWAIASQPYARAESGLGASFHGLGWKHVAGASLMTIVLSMLILIGQYGLEDRLLVDRLWSSTALPIEIVWKAVGLSLGSFFIGIAGAYVFARMIVRKLGGMTGDTYGAICELVLTLLLLVRVAL